MNKKVLNVIYTIVNIVELPIKLLEMPFEIVKFFIIKAYGKQDLKDQENAALDAQPMQTMTVDEYLNKIEEASKKCGCDDCKSRLIQVANAREELKKKRTSEPEEESVECTECHRMIKPSKGCKDCEGISQR